MNEAEKKEHALDCLDAVLGVDGSLASAYNLTCCVLKGHPTLCAPEQQQAVLELRDYIDQARSLCDRLGGYVASTYLREEEES